MFRNALSFTIAIVVLVAALKYLGGIHASLPEIFLLVFGLYILHDEYRDYKNGNPKALFWCGVFVVIVLDGVIDLAAMVAGALV